jgi:hypothetical protein
MDKRSRRNGLFNTIQVGELQSYKLMLLLQGQAPPMPAAQALLNYKP